MTAPTSRWALLQTLRPPRARPTGGSAVHGFTCPPRVCPLPTGTKKNRDEPGTGLCCPGLVLASKANPLLPHEGAAHPDPPTVPVLCGTGSARGRSLCCCAQGRRRTPSATPSSSCVCFPSKSVLISPESPPPARRSLTARGAESRIWVLSQSSEAPQALTGPAPACPPAPEALRGLLRP